MQFEKCVVEDWDVLYGSSNPRQLVIRVMTDCAPDQQDETFFHECIHALSFAYGLGLTENQVRVLGASLTAFLKDNRLLRE